MYNVDPVDQSVVISGFEKGIGASPYAGLTDVKSCNISSIQGEASVNFSTSSVTPPSITNASVTSASNSVAGLQITFTGAVGLENGMCISFSSVTVGNLSANTPYWVFNVGNSGGNGICNLSANFNQAAGVSYSSGGTGTFSTFNMGTPVSFANAHGGGQTGNNYTQYMADVNGAVWTNDKTTTSGYWEFTGNTTTTNPLGQLVYYEVTDGTTRNGYLFLFRQNVIDYLITTVSNHNLSWTYGWDPASGTTGNTSGLDTTYASHYAILAPDNRVYFCNGSNIQKFFQTASGTIFDPATKSTYTYSTYNLLPIDDKAQSLTPLGTQILIGGLQNVVYAWDTTSNLISYPILLPESNVAQMVTVNTNAYLFVGNRGWIYITNGSQVSPFVKVPDHISNTVEPYFQWQGAVYQKNRLYFGVRAFTNSGSDVAGYGGVWCVDLTTNAIYLSNQLSFGDYSAGNCASALLALPANPNNQPFGVGIFVGWSANGINGVDKSISTPYTAGQSYVISDMIPIGTLLDPVTPLQIEFKLSAPLKTGESIQIYTARNLTDMLSASGTYTNWKTVNGDGSIISGNLPAYDQQFQWILVKAILTTISSSPSYTRLTQLRILKATKQLTSFSSLE